MNYNPMLLAEELQTAGLPAVGASSDGRGFYARALTGAEKATEAQVKAAHNPALPAKGEQALVVAKASAAKHKGKETGKLTAADRAELQDVVLAGDGLLKVVDGKLVVNGAG